MADMGPNSEGLNVYQAQEPAPTPKQREEREVEEVIGFIRRRASWYRTIQAGGGGKLTADLAGSDAEALEMVADFVDSLRTHSPEEPVGYGVFGEGGHEELPKRWLVASEGEDGVRTRAEALATCEEYRHDFPQHTYTVRPIGPPLEEEGSDG